MNGLRYVTHVHECCGNMKISQTLLYTFASVTVFSMNNHLKMINIMRYNVTSFGNTTYKGRSNPIIDYRDMYKDSPTGSAVDRSYTASLPTLCNLGLGHLNFIFRHKFVTECYYETHRSHPYLFFYALTMRYPLTVT